MFAAKVGVPIKNELRMRITITDGPQSVRAQSTLNAGIAGLRAGGFRFFVIVKCLDSGGKSHTRSEQGLAVEMVDFSCRQRPKQTVAFDYPFLAALRSVQHTTAYSWHRIGPKMPGHERHPSSSTTSRPRVSRKNGIEHHKRVLLAVFLGRTVSHEDDAFEHAHLGSAARPAARCSCVHMVLAI